MKEHNWYELNDPGKIDSPALLIFKDRVASNIQTMIRIAGDASRLVPHVKTHKMAEIVKMQISAGIYQFKCATIAEAEMLALTGAKNILLAYQLTATKAGRFIQLIKKYPDIQFSSLVDNFDSACLLHELFLKENMIAKVFIDVDAGMHRTGIAPDDSLFNLYKELDQLSNISCNGLHVYDGNIREENFELRKEQCENDFAKVNEIVEKIISLGFPDPLIIAGGTPTFTVHALHDGVFCSPGTCLLWDYGYDQLLPEQPFKFAVVLMTRIISKPARGLITTDLGHKSVAAENAVSKRIFFLNLENYIVRSQSEEHLVVEVNNWDDIHVGDVLYGIPHHICPTVALYDEAHIIDQGMLVDVWNIIARKKKITI
ncbi:MAG: D-TA family PLP-dependent enzyme [Bacteroidota bacterium]|nr:D-TA family PLP-dependent enzyme [Bacteroidota bacterium]